MATTTSRPTRSCVSCYTYDASRKGTVPTPCCSRFVCGPCARGNSRLAETCILCQLPIPRDLARAKAEDEDETLPGYDEDGVLPSYPPDRDASLARPPHFGDDKTSHDITGRGDTSEKSTRQGEGGGGYKEIGVQHYVRREDSVAGLSLAYNVPAHHLRKTNHLFSDSLLQARSFILVPGARVSLSAHPGQDEAEKVKLKKFMVAVKCTDYDMAKSTYLFRYPLVKKTRMVLLTFFPCSVHGGM